MLLHLKTTVSVMLQNAALIKPLKIKLGKTVLSLIIAECCSMKGTRERSFKWPFAKSDPISISNFKHLIIWIFDLLAYFRTKILCF